MKEDEQIFLINLQNMTIPGKKIPRVRELILEMDMNEKRAVYILDKWTSKGLYDYGVSILCGWLTAEGMNKNA